MATPTVKTTYALDLETVRVIEELARRWNVSRSEVLRRAVRASASRKRSSAPPEAVRALDQLQAAFRFKPKDAARWARDARSERHAASRRRGESDAVIHLDTSFLVRALVRDSPPDRRLRAWLAGSEALALSTIAWAEFLCGPVDPSLLGLVVRILPQRIPFGEEEALLAAGLFNETGRRRGSLADCMIAATAIRAQAHLATENPVDFRRFQAAGLQLA